MWERFCFYGMRGMLTVFMVTQLGLDDKQANLQYGAIQAFVYAFTFIGGVFADKILGFQKSLDLGGGDDDPRRPRDRASRPSDMFYIGTCFTIIGTGFFKPNISDDGGRCSTTTATAAATPASACSTRASTWARCSAAS